MKKIIIIAIILFVFYALDQSGYDGIYSGLIATVEHVIMIMNLGLNYLGQLI